ncbi:hypothetical protein MMC21_003994, partial [Puttea exsequens]|nr:hypothetical protein [Puttea exsequens]
HALAFSKNLPSIRDCFESLCATVVGFEIGQVEQDIRQAIRALLPEDPKMKWWPKAVQQDVKAESMT